METAKKSNYAKKKFFIGTKVRKIVTLNLLIFEFFLLNSSDKFSADGHFG
jgi:hypothetical protein